MSFDSQEDLHNQAWSEAWNYATHHGLCKNFLQENFFHIINKTSSFAPHMALGTDIFESVEGLLIAQLEEKLAVESSALFLLEKSIVILQEADNPSIISNNIARKLDLPLLSWDEEIDVIRIHNSTRSDFKQKIISSAGQNEFRSTNSDAIDCQNDCQNAINGDLHSEKLAATRQCLSFLEGILQEPKYERLELEIETKQYVKNVSRVYPVTPPLYPCCMNLPDISWDDNDVSLPLLSDAIDDDDKMLKDIQEKIQQSDKIPSDERIMIDFSLDTSDDTGIDNVSSVELGSSSSLRVNVPLLPFTPSHGDLKLSSLFDDFKQRWLTQSSNEPESSAFDLNLIHEIETLAEKGTSAINQERLISADPSIRVEVPLVTQIVFPSPWHQRLECFHFNESDSRWPGTSSFERTMNWRPFPARLHEVALEEHLEPSECLVSVAQLISSEGIVTSSSFSTQIPLLRILGSLKDEFNHLDYGSFPENERGIDYLIKKRKAWDEMSSSRISPKIIKTVNSYSSTVTERTNLRPKPHHVDTPSPLDVFLTLKGIAAPTIPPAQPISGDSSQVKLNKNDREPKSINHGIILEPIVNNVLLPTNLPTRYVIVSPEFLQTQRPLLRELGRIYPSCEIFERDHPPDNNSQMNDQVSDAVDADLTISPSIGLLITTIRKIQQQSLPGNGPPENMFNSRLGGTSYRYEKLIVLVSQGTVEDKPGLNNLLGLNLTQATERTRITPNFSVKTVSTDETIAIASLQAFANTLSTDIHLQFVLGGEAGLASWISHYISALGIAIRIEAEESLWEQVLRRAGLNAFAAGTILTALKKPEEPTESQRATKIYGIAKFMGMRSQDRILQFQSMLGGTKVLERVNKCLESEWISKSTGYKTGQKAFR